MSVGLVWPLTGRVCESLEQFSLAVVSLEATPSRIFLHLLYVHTPDGTEWPRPTRHPSKVIAGLVLQSRRGTSGLASICYQQPALIAAQVL